jgi:hypothetical protein
MSAGSLESAIQVGLRLFKKEEKIADIPKECKFFFVEWQF